MDIEELNNLCSDMDDVSYTISDNYDDSSNTKIYYLSIHTAKSRFSADELADVIAAMQKHNYKFYAIRTDGYRYTLTFRRAVPAGDKQ